MRDPVHEARPQPSLTPGGSTLSRAEPERRCILSGETAARSALVRLVEGPDGMLWPDLSARLPGRGAWIAPDRARLEEAMARGRLKPALARAFRGPAPVVPPDLADRIESGLAVRALDRLGLEHRAGRLLLGTEKILAAVRAGRLALLVHAADAAADGCARLDQAVRSGGGHASIIVAPVGRERLSGALGRDNSVHIGVADQKAAARIRGELMRWIRFARPDRSQAPAPGQRPGIGEGKGQE